MANNGRRKTTVKDHGWAWMVVVGAFFTSFIASGFVKSMGVIHIMLEDHFKCSLFEASLPLLITYIVYCFCLPFCMLLTSVFSIRQLVIFGSVVGCTGMALSSLLVNLTWFVTLFGVCYGISLATFFANILVLLAHYFNKRLSLATGLAVAGTSCGQFGWPLIIEYLSDNFGFGGVILILSGIHLNLCVCGALMRPAEPEDFVQESEKDDGDFTSGKTPKYNKKSASALLLPRDTNSCNATQLPTYPKTNGVSACPEVYVDDYDISRQLNRNLDKVRDDDDKHSLCRSVGSHGGSLCVRIDDNTSMMSEPRHRFHQLYDKGSIASSIHSIYLFTEGFKGSNTAVSIKGSTIKSENIPQRPGPFKDLVSKLSKMFDISLLRNYVVLNYMVYMFLVLGSFTNFTAFLPDIIAEKVYGGYKKALLFSLVGFGDLVGRVLTGIIADLRTVRRYQLKAAVSLFGALVILSFYVFRSEFVMHAQCFLYGFCNGAFVCLMTLVCVDFMCLDTVPKALALALPTEGLAVGLGLTVLSSLRDSTGSYLATCIICCGLMVLGAVFICLMPWFSVKERKKISCRSNGSLCLNIEN